jgi:hypothetical protein
VKPQPKADADSTTPKNPEAILQAIRVTKAPSTLPRQIKIAPLYIDYKIAMVSQ